MYNYKLNPSREIIQSWLWSACVVDLININPVPEVQEYDSWSLDGVVVFFGWRNDGRGLLEVWIGT